MSISGLGSVFQTQKTEEVAGIQRIRKEQESGDQKSASSSCKTDSVTISAEAHRMSAAMREKNTLQVASIKADSTNNAATVTENGVLENITVKALPDSILARSDQHLAQIKEKGTKVLFEFGDAGSNSIKSGLSREDYIRAQATLREWEMHEPGLGF